MGLIMSFMGKGLPSKDSTELLRFLVQTCNRFNDKEIKDFHELHVAILDIFNTINSALPGKHYDVPSRKEVEECFNDWKKADVQEEKREVFVNFIKKRVNLSEVDHSIVITGIVTPPAAMLAKRAGEKVSQLKAIKAIPDVLFVPSATLLAIISIEFSRRLFMENIRHPNVPN